MITIEQLLESVDLDFEPRWVTKNALGIVAIRSGEKPKPESPKWIGSTKRYESFGQLKLAEFENKPWQECIYEVPRKIDEYEQNLEKLRPADSDLVYRVKLPRKTTGEIEHIKTRKSIDCSDTPEAHIEKHRTFVEIWDKINELVDAVNELKENKGV